MTHQLNQDFFNYREKWDIDHGYVNNKTKHFIIDSSGNADKMFRQDWTKIGGTDSSLFLSNGISDWEKSFINYYYDKLVFFDGDKDKAYQTLMNRIDNYTKASPELIKKQFEHKDYVAKLNALYDENLSLGNNNPGFTNQTKDIVRQSSIVDVQEPIHINKTLNERYQDVINERIYSYKDFSASQAKKKGYHPDYVNQIRSSNLEEFSSKIRQQFDEGLSSMIPENQKQLMMQMGESTTYSGMYYGEIVSGRADAFIDAVRNLPIKQDALLLRKNDALILFAHGTKDGKIAFNRAAYSSENFVQMLYDKHLIPDDIKKIYTMNCYGGKQQSFIGPNGVEVKSAHTSTTPIIGCAIMDFENPMFVTSLNTGDMIDEFKEFSMADGKLEVLYSSNEINEAFGIGERKSSWGNATVVDVEEVVDEPPVSQSKKQKYKPVKGPKLKEKVSDTVNIEPQDITKQSNPKYYTQDQLDTIFNFEHKRTAYPTNETKFKDVRYDEAGEHFDFTNFDEFQKIGGNKSFAKLIINKDHQDIIKKYWNLLNKVDGNPLIASKESILLFSDIENQIIDQYIGDINKAFTEHATNGMHNDINRYLKDNMDIHNQMVKHYLDTGEILNPYYQSQDLVTEETTEQIVKNTTEETIEEITEETGKQAEHNFKETLEQSAKEMAEESSKKVSKSTAKSLPKKSLGGGGKAAIAIAGLIIGGMILSSDNEPKKKSEKSKGHSLPRSTNAEEFDNSYAMQMAQDISSYRYGKHMTGFVNY